MKVKINKMLICFIVVIFTIMPASVFASTNNETTKVIFNEINVKINGNNHIGNRIIYNNTVYLSVKSVAEIFNLDVNFYEKEKIIYIGQIPAGEVPKNVIDSWENINQKDKVKEQILISKGSLSIDAIFNSFNIKIHGEKMHTDNFFYNNNTFISLKEVCKILDVNCNYYEPTSTIYVGMIPQNEVPYDVYKKWVSNKEKDLYSEPATGDMIGWQKLIGHEYQSVADIYYKLDGSILSVTVKDIRKVDLNKIVEWVDDYGVKRYNTVEDVYELFSDFSPYTTEWFSNKFGELYANWLLVSSIKAENIVTDYLESTGQIEKQNNVTLTPDAEFKVVEPENEDVSTEEVIKDIENYMKSQQ